MAGVKRKKKQNSRKRKRSHGDEGRKRKRAHGETLKYTSKKNRHSKYFNVTWDRCAKKWLAKKKHKKKFIIDRKFHDERLAALAVNWVCEEEGIKPPNTTVTSLCSAIATDGGCQHGDSENWVRCKDCELWFHAKCTNLSAERLKLENPNFECSMCKKEGPSWHDSNKLVGTQSDESDEDMDSQSELFQPRSDPPENTSESEDGSISSENIAEPRNDAPRRPVQFLDMQRRDAFVAESDPPEDSSIPKSDPPELEAPPDPEMPPLELPSDVLDIPLLHSVAVREVIDITDSPRNAQVDAPHEQANSLSEEEKGDAEEGIPDRSVVHNLDANPAEQPFEKGDVEGIPDQSDVRNLDANPEQLVQINVEENPAPQDVEEDIEQNQPNNAPAEGPALDDDAVLAYFRQLDVQARERLHIRAFRQLDPQERGQLYTTFFATFFMNGAQNAAMNEN